MYTNLEMKLNIIIIDIPCVEHTLICLRDGSLVHYGSEVICVHSESSLVVTNSSSETLI